MPAIMLNAKIIAIAIEITFDNFFFSRYWTIGKRTTANKIANAKGTNMF